jgi:hypothetical protein
LQKKRKHHDIWRAYLAGWTTNNSIFCLRNGEIFKSGLMGVANRRDFYKLERLSDNELAFIKRLAIDPTKPHLQEVNQGWLDTFTAPYRIADLVQRMRPDDKDALEVVNAAFHNLEEDLHSRIESHAAKYLRALRNRDASFFLNDLDCIDFTHFLCVQYMRTARMQTAGERVAPELGSLRFEAMWNILRHLYASNMAWVIYAERARWRVTFLDNSPLPSRFIAGDQPVINTYALLSPGQEPSGLELYYPLSPQLALLVSEKPEMTNGACLTLNIEQVRHYNEHIFHNSYEQVYADSADTLEQIRMLGKPRLN